MHQDDISYGIPLLRLEPSCMLTFRDEMLNFFLSDNDAQRLAKQSYLLSEFIMKYVNEDKLAKIDSKALLHFHCHHVSVLKTQDETTLLEKMGVDFNALDSGCCGLAGSFGFEKNHHEIAMQSGERVLLPAVREQDKNTMILTNGFSCREQVQGTNRKAVHLAELMHMAIKEENYKSNGETPEDYYQKNYGQEYKEISVVPALLILVGAVAVIGFASLWNRNT